MTCFRWIATAAVVAMSVIAYAQTDQGRFTGTVRDQTNAFVGGAKVKVKNERTGEERMVSATSRATSWSGRSSRPPTRFALKRPASRPSSTPACRRRRPGAEPRLRVQAGRRHRDGHRRRQRAGARHQLGADRRQRQRARSAEPAGQRPADVAADAAGARLAERRHRHLAGHPLLAAAPSSRTSSSTTASRARRSSTRRRATLNGENATPFKLQASLENVQEFRVESSSYPAEFGTGTGGQVSVITKSGGNAFHGSVFEYLPQRQARRAELLRLARATPTAACIAELPKSPLKQNQFGGSVGGPLAKDRAFFFGSYEGYRLDAGMNFVEAVPSAAAWARAVPAIARCVRGSLAPGAVILPGASTNPDFDIAQLQAHAERRRRTRSAPASTSS